MTAVPASAPAVGLIGRLGDLASDIKISHTVFALPFALLSAFVAAGGWPGWGRFALVLVCMVSARTAAMTSNRLLDARLDAANPRTRNRAIPAGRLSAAFVTATLFAASLAFFVGAGGFWWFFGNRWPLILSPVVLAFLCAYPLTKRFTQLCHVWLGLALGCAPVCAWIAVRGDVAWAPVVLGLAVTLWTAGFDIVYACQDHAVDVQLGLKSVPSALGIAGALWAARAIHVASAALFIASARLLPGMGLIYAAGVAVACCLLVYQHVVVRGGNLSRVNLAFFTLNGIISVLLGSLGILDVFL